jgi:hypothetical protein
MNASASNTDDGRKVAPVYVLWNGETTLDSSIENAWPHVIDYASWQNYSIVEHVSGERGQEGQVMRLKKDELGPAFPPYYARTIKLDPQRRIVWKVYPETPGQALDYFGIVDFKLYEASGKVRFRYDMVYEYLLPYQDEAELSAFRRMKYENLEKLLAAVLPKLKTLVEGKSAA